MEVQRCRLPRFYALWQEKPCLARLETFIYQELRKYTDWYERDLNFYHFRNKDNV